MHEPSKLVPLEHRQKSKDIDYRRVIDVQSKGIQNVNVYQRGAMVEIRREVQRVKINGEYVDIDAPQLIRMIKQITQTIGEHKRTDNAYGLFVIPALRKARSDMVSSLEHIFGIHWEINRHTGESRFFC